MVSGLVHPSYNGIIVGSDGVNSTSVEDGRTKVTRKHWEVTENVEVAWGYHFLEFITGGSCDVSIAIS